MRTLLLLLFDPQTSRTGFTTLNENAFSEQISQISQILEFVDHRLSF